MSAMKASPVFRRRILTYRGLKMRLDAETQQGINSTVHISYHRLSIPPNRSLLPSSSISTLKPVTCLGTQKRQRRTPHPSVRKRKQDAIAPLQIPTQLTSFDAAQLISTSHKRTPALTLNHADHPRSHSATVALTVEVRGRYVAPVALARISLEASRAVLETTAYRA